MVRGSPKEPGGGGGGGEVTWWSVGVFAGLRAPYGAWGKPFSKSHCGSLGGWGALKIAGFGPFSLSLKKGDRSALFAIGSLIS